MLNVDTIAREIVTKFSNEQNRIGRKLADKIVRDVFEQIKQANKNGEIVKIVHFGYFLVNRREAQSMSVWVAGAWQTRGIRTVQAQNQVRFKPFRKYNEAVN